MSLRWSIRGESGNEISIHVPKQPFEPQSGPYDDALQCEINIYIPPFSGLYSMNISVRDIRAFLTDLRQRLDELNGKTVFHTIESGLELAIEFRSRKGLAAVRGKATPDIHGAGVTLTFGFATDQSFLASTVSDLDQVVHCYPIHGQ
jgi:hypothetical protein